MESSRPGRASTPTGSSISTGDAHNSPLAGSMDAPPMPVADRFTEEVVVGTSADRLTDGSDLPGSVQTASGSSRSSGSSADAAKGAAGQAADKTKAVAGQAADTAREATGQAADAAKAAPGRAKEWITAHPLVAIGAGLIGGIVLGGMGGGGSGTHHHHHYSDRDESRHQSSGDQSSQSSQSSHTSGGLFGMVQQTGLLDTLTQSAGQLMSTANDRASDLMRQRVPGFEDQLRQKQGHSNPAATGRPAETVTRRPAPVTTTR